MHQALMEVIRIQWLMKCILKLSKRKGFSIKTAITDTQFKLQ